MSLVIILIRREGEPPGRECVDVTYIVNRKRVVRELQVYELHREGYAHNWYTDKEGYKVSLRSSEDGPYAPPQCTLN